MSGCSPSGRCPMPVTLILLIIYFCYLLLGATVFWLLESEAEHDLTHNFQHEKWELLRNHTCMDNRSLELLIRGIINAYKKGVSLMGNSSSLETWSFAGSFFFSVTAITTIGYGNLSPTTMSGRIFCVFFALFGIPLNLILLNRIGRRMLYLVHRYSDFMGRKIRQQRPVKFFSSVCAVVAGLLLFFLLPPILFRWMEGWTYEEGFYYAFITLSTIGFGDYVIGRVPENHYPSWYRSVVSLWILFGMAWLALIINLCINLLEKSKKSCHCCRKAEHRMKEELMDITHNGHVPSELQDAEDPTTSDTKPKSPD